MAKPNKILFSYIKFFSITIFFCFITSFVVLAQEETSVDIAHPIQEYGALTDQENSDFSKIENKKQNFWEQQKSALQLKQASKQGEDKEAGKEGMSTLSFNLFLYVVDKFKEKEDI